tara:strand:- start:2176 stop:4500 length:2325 start_codon:yes stop_codon:yes gene_type:complete
MKIKNITLRNFRPFFGESSIDIDSQVERIVFVGPNDSGKTEILNAIYWCIWGKFLTKLMKPNEWSQAWNNNRMEPGIFNNKAFYALKEGRVGQVMVSVEFSLEEDETQNITSVSSPTLELTRSLYFGKDLGKPILYSYDQDVFPETDWNEADNLHKLRTPSWDGKLALRHPTENGNLSISNNATLDRDYYFPNEDVTKFTLLDTVILNKYLSTGQSNNEKNINSVSNVNNIVKVTEQMNKIMVDYRTTKERLERQSEGSNKDFKDMLDERDIKQRRYDSLTEDKSLNKDTIIKAWEGDFNLDIKAQNTNKLNEFKPEKYSNINVLRFRIQFIDKILKQLTILAGGNAEGADLVKKLSQQKKDKKKLETDLLASEENASNNYVDLSIRVDSMSILKEFRDNINIERYTPPPLTKEYLEQLLNEKLCCCGTVLDEKKTPDLVKAIRDLINITVDQNTSSQLANINSRSRDFTDNLYMSPHYEILVNDIDKIKDLDSDITDLNSNINKTVESINRMGGIDKINESSAEQARQKKTADIRQKYIDSRQIVIQYLSTLATLAGDLATSIKDLTTRINSHEIKVEGLDDAKLRLDFSEDVIEKLSKLKNDFQVDIKEKIKNGFKDEFEKMHWREDYQIKINDNFKISLEDKNGMNLTDITSQGGSQIACMAFMRTLGKFSSLNLPLIADTPFGNLQNKVRVKVSEVLLSDNTNPQLFLLCSDSELTSPPELSKIIFDDIRKDKICCYEIERKRGTDGNDYSQPNKVDVKQMKDILKKSTM